MAAQKGKDFLLKIGGTAVAGLRATSMTINNELVDITSKDSAGFRTLLEGAGVQSMTITANGVASDGATFETLQSYAQAGSINTMTLVATDTDAISASFLISSFERSGDFNKEETFSATLESSGTITYTNA